MQHVWRDYERMGGLCNVNNHANEGFRYGRGLHMSFQVIIKFIFYWAIKIKSIKLVKQEFSITNNICRLEASLVPVEQCNADTVLQIIQQYILPGTNVFRLLGSI